MNFLNVKQYLGKKELVDVPTEEEIKHEVDEVRISTSFGHISGKWWNSKKLKPCILLHGWQDNSGTFDRLIPLLPKEFSYFAIDLPGHGLSSKIPDGMSYHTIDNVTILNNLFNEYDWKKVTIIGHSMGSAIAFLFASIFPDRVEMVVGLDSLRPPLLNPVHVPNFIEDRVKNFMIADKRNQEKSDPPAYKYNEMIDRLVEGTFSSVTKECAPYLLKRAIKRSKKYPGKYYFTRDSRLKYHYGNLYGHEVIVAMTKRLTMPYLYIEALNSPSAEPKHYKEELIGILKNNPNFENYIVDSTHHLHLINPEKVAPLITQFLRKNNSKSKL